MKRFIKTSPSSGFTLIELLIVISTILILIAIALLNFITTLVKSKVARFEADFRALATTIEF
ncbi:MAG: prepilin-type N-terminal cleavage/methylation domain-containing protein [Candidatus Omnitrophica bacterium]|nr:prepilin-type N-terminal cleavage/methylation domain-containing protein [Candidatus Omnitrophota bacterium]